MKNKIYLIASLPVVIVLIMFLWSFIGEMLSAKSDVAVAVGAAILSLTALIVIFIINKLKNKTK